MPAYDVAKAIASTVAARGVEAEIKENVLTDRNGNPVRDKHGNTIKTYSTVVTKVPDVEADALAFFTPSFTPPNIELANLLTQYKSEVSQNKGCSDCARGKLIRKYLPYVRDALRRHKLQSTGAISVSGLAETGAAGTQQKRGLLQRASAGFKTLLKIGSRKK